MKGKDTILIYIFALFFVSGALSLSGAYAQWFAPTGQPPLYNVSAPINVGPTNQRKEGGITLGADLFLERGVKFFSIGGSDDSYLSNIADSLVYESSLRGNIFSIENNGNVNVTGDLSVSGSLFVGGQDISSGVGAITSESDPTVPNSLKDGVDWSEISGIPSGFADGIDNEGVNIDTTTLQNRVSGACLPGQAVRSINQDGTVVCESVVGSGITTESDPTVAASVKDGVDWSEISGIPAGFADGVDNEVAGISPNSIGSNEIIDGSILSSDIDSSSIQRRVSGSCDVGDYISSINQDGTVVCSTPMAGGIKGINITRVHSGPGGRAGDVFCGLGDLLVGVGCYDSIGSASGPVQCTCASYLDGGRGCTGYFSNDAFIYCLDL